MNTSTKTNRTAGGTSSLVKVLAMLLLPMLVVMVAACDTGSSGGTTPRAAYAGVPEGKPTGSTAPIPDPKEVVQTKAVGELPDFVMNMTAGPARDKTMALYKGAVENYDDFSHIPCYCGCAAYTTHHTSLASCFLKDKPGAEATFTDHSTSCDLCQEAAQMTVDGVAKGTPLKDIRAAVFKKLNYTGIWTDTAPVP